MGTNHYLVRVEKDDRLSRLARALRPQIAIPSSDGRDGWKRLEEAIAEAEAAATVERRLHMGKSSAGWYYAVRQHKRYGLETLADWFTFIGQVLDKGGRVEDEYGKTLTRDQWMAVVLSREPWEYRPDSWFTSQGACRGWHGLAYGMGTRLGDGPYVLGESSQDETEGW